MSCEHLDETAGLALGALSEREAEAARRHAAECHECEAALARYQATVRALESELPRVAPPPPDTARLRPERRRALLVATLAALVAIVVVVGVRRGHMSSQPVASISPGNAGARTHGDAHIVGPGRGGSYLVLHLQAVPPPPPGRHYEVWVVPHGSSAMAPLGALPSGGRSVTVRLPLPGPGPYDAVDVSVQRDGGPRVNSGIHLASGAFEGS